MKINEIISKDPNATGVESLQNETPRTLSSSLALLFHMHAYAGDQLCPTLCDPMDCSPPGSFVHGILQARIPEWICHFLLQAIFLTQASNPHLLHLLHWQVDLYHWATWQTPSPTPVLITISVFLFISILPSLSNIRRRSEKAASFKSRWESSLTKNQSCWTLILDFLPPELCGNSPLLFKLLIQRRCVMAAWADWGRFQKMHRKPRHTELSVIQEEGRAGWLWRCNHAPEHPLWYPQTAPFCSYNVLIHIQR